MIIGAIEYCSQQEVSGWIYSPKHNLTGETVLAFMDGQCIGSGEIGNLRQDLVDAGLEDGRFGYHFWITMPQGRDPKSVIVTLRDCEAFLKQSDAVIGAPRRSEVPWLCGAVPKGPQLDWLCDKGIVDGAQVTTLRSLAAFGVALHRCESSAEDCATHLEGLLEALALGPVALDYIELSTGPDFREQLLAHPAAQKAGIFVLQAQTRCSFLVREEADGASGAGLPAHAAVALSDFGAVSYFCDAQTSLVIRRGTPFKVKPAMTTDRVRCYFPVPLEAKTSDTAILFRPSGAALQLQDSFSK